MVPKKVCSLTAVKKILVCPHGGKDCLSGFGNEKKVY